MKSTSLQAIASFLSVIPQIFSFGMCISEISLPFIRDVPTRSNYKLEGKVQGYGYWEIQDNLDTKPIEVNGSDARTLAKAYAAYNTTDDIKKQIIEDSVYDSRVGAEAFDGAVDVKCEEVANIDFSIPSDIQFQDQCEMMKQMQKQAGQMQKQAEEMMKNMPNMPQ